MDDTANIVSGEVQIRVSYAMTDQMGFVYYGNYAEYYELGRTELMRSIGLSYKALEDKGIQMPMLDMKIKYLRPAHYDDLLTIRTTICEMPAARVSFFYEIFNEAGELLNQGETTLAFIDSKTHRPLRPPKEMLEILGGLLKKP